MEPIMQRFGDVTIQRLEKPKAPKPEAPEKPRNEQEERDRISIEEITQQHGSKRPFPDSQVSVKRFKVTPEQDQEVGTKKPQIPTSFPDNKTHKFLEDHHLGVGEDEDGISEDSDDISDFETESDVESEGDFNNLSDKAVAAAVGVAGKPDLDEDDESTNTSFIEKFGDDPFAEGETDETAKPQEKGEEDAEDYDFDIKEKLKEMGEISFQTVKKGEKPKKVEVSTENEVVVTPARKTGTADEEASAERKGLNSGLNLRRNIREVMDETKLDESTLAAQRQEAERLQRVQEQQRLLRELQRQAAQERMQHKVISLLQGNNAARPGTSNATTRIGNTVLVKLPNGQTKPMTRLPKRPFDLVKIHKSSGPIGPNFGKNAGLISVKRPVGANLTPSVSIAPVAKRAVAPLAKMLQSDDSDSEEDVKPPPQPKMNNREPVATIDISSDEDCIVVSEPETEETDDDPGNSGMHTNDEFNQPDGRGRVVVNVGHPDDEPDIFLAPQIARIIKPHQIGGVRFLYDNVIESTGRFEGSAGFGCILAHSMGLGKTLQVVSFSDIFLRHTPAKTILCIMPINTLQNWLAEYNMWLPTAGVPNEETATSASPLLTGEGEIRHRTFNLHVLNDSHKTLVARAKVIHEWKTGGGVLLIGYEQFRLLSLKKHPKSRRKTAILERPDDDKNKALFDDVHEALVRPGPDLVICDEGHRIKNSHASISQALKQMRTKRRVVLTGYPLQNNLMEYWCMVDFVRPNYLGSKTEFCNMFERPIMNGQCIDSTETDIKLMRYRAHVLHSLLVGFVQRRSHSVLQTALPQKEEYVLLVRMLPFQRKLYETFMDEVVRSQAVPNPLKAFAVCCKIWNHPDVLYNFLKKRARGDAVDIDLEEVGGAPAEPSKATKKPTARAKRGAKSKKPAASITPYNNTSSEISSVPQSVNPRSEFNNQSNNSCYSGDSQSYPQQFLFDQSNAQFPNFGHNREKGPTDFVNSFQNSGSFESASSNQNFINNISDNSQYPGSSTNNFGGFEQGNFQNYQQNYWGQQQQQRDFYNYNQNYGNGNNNQAWIKTEEGSSPVKCENSSESKPKINIISDIKLPAFDKKIKILSDIKLEPKPEDGDDRKFDIKQEIKNELKSDIKNDIKNKLEGVEDDSTISKVEPPLAKLSLKDMKEDSGIPYDWAIELLKDYVPGCIENSAKMEILFCIIRESLALGDRLLVFSQSLITLDLIEQFLQMNLVPGDTVKWARNTSYYRLDGSTSALEREKLINEFNSNPKIHLFLVSTRAGSLGINLIGANRVVVLDASWNPCHDTQAVCRVYRYGQKKPCFVYRLVVDNCLEKKIYDRQINKQGMSDRVVDECNPDAHLTMKDVSTLCWDDKTDEGEEKDWIHLKDNYVDVVLQKVIELHGRRFNKEPFRHESLLVDRKEKQLSQLEKRLAKKGYEREKQAARQPAYNVMGAGRGGHRPVASVRPMQQGNERPSRWIPAEHWQRQGMTAQEMTLPLDVVIPTNQPEKGNIVLKAGQKVLVLKSPKGVYMQLESGKIVAIKTAIKVKGKAEDNKDPAKMINQNLPPTAIKMNPSMSVPPQKRLVKPFVPGATKMNVRSVRQAVPNFVSSRIQSVTRKGGQPRPFPSPNPHDLRSPQKEHEPFPGSSSDEEHAAHDRHHQNNLDIVLPGRVANTNSEIEKQISLLKKQVSVRRLPSVPAGQEQKHHASALQRLEQTTTSVLNDNRPFQETLDSITSSYKDDGLEDEISSTNQSNKTTSSRHQVPSDPGSDQSDEVTYVSEQPPPGPLVQPYTQTQPQQPNAATAASVKSDQGDYNNTYNNYYNYNNMQPYHNAQPQQHPHPHPPPQGYAYAQAPSYDMMGYPQPQQPPQYNYGYQGYPPHYAQPPHPPPQGGYDYSGGAPPPPVPPQPLYGGYGSPYPQQYAAPPVAPPAAMYAPPQQAQPSANYQDYANQYPAAAQTPYYPPT